MAVGNLSTFVNIYGEMCGAKYRFVFEKKEKKAAKDLNDCGEVLWDNGSECVRTE